VSKSTTNLSTLRDQTDDELRSALANTRDELFRLQLGQYTNQVTSTAALATKRRDIARIMTILRGRELGSETQAQKSASGATEGSATKTKTTRKAKAKS